ncbi:hypothetical protein DCAR_0727545 [Daucus carota subsp. sativus]|uniref:Protein yippee-like n=1 Tax=Daucus carota subsp. sativus TaxID=79200 RepID=A0AAF1B826_DAUCS|nr:hypothetical protein DCAR_0727545 [Daucus carota subsp. sativus]
MVTLEGNVYSCKHCKTHLAVCDDIISKVSIMNNKMNATCLIFHRENVTVGEKEQRMMMTGMHIVVDIFCVTCGSIVGWKYESAYEKSQKYKEGKYILERYAKPINYRFWTQTICFKCIHVE